MKTPFRIACKKLQFDVVITNSKLYSINLNARQVNGMTPFDSEIGTVIRYDFRIIMCI